MKGYYKLGLIAVMLLVMTFFATGTFLLPSQKENENRINSIYNSIAMLYDKDSDTYTDPGQVNLFQQEIRDLEYSNRATKLLSFFLISTMLTVIISLLATLMQYVYTNLKFTQDHFNPKVLMVCLVCTTVLVCLTYYLTFTT